MPINSWSHSRLVQFESCPRRAYLLYDARIPEPERSLPPGKTEHANDRGTRVHEACERFVRGEGELPVEAATHFTHEFNALRELYQEGRVSLEGEWAMNQAWEPVGWNGDWEEFEPTPEEVAAAEPLKALPERPKGGDWGLYRGKYVAWVPSWLRLKLDAMVHVSETEAISIDYKGLPLHTPLPTPTGWTTMGEVAIGDHLIAQNGNACTVIGKSAVKHLPCYRLTFDDTSAADCDNEHLWTLVNGDVVPVTELKVGDIIPTANAMILPVAELPIDPYVLGFWLADGKHTSGEISKPDDDVWDEVRARGYELGFEQGGGAKCRSHTVIGLRTELRKLGLLENKHIPPAYLRASYGQRLDLLRGIMDGDGSANITRKQAVMNTVCEAFAMQVKELLLSLGQRPLVRVDIANGFGKHTYAYFVSFRPRGLNPFKLRRKASKIEGWGIGESWRRRIVRIDELPPQDTQCIMVDSVDNTFLCTRNFIPTHNTGRKFGNELKHAEQLQLYQLVCFLRYPKLEVVTTELWYLDQDDLTAGTFTRAQGLRFKRAWDSRGTRLTTATDFPPNPTIHTCKYCPYGPAHLGGTGHCSVGVK